MRRQQRIFFDIDGTLAEWNSDASIEEVTTKGYFANCKPMSNTISMMRKIIERHSDKEVYILSAVFQDNHSIQDKLIWIKHYIPEMQESKCIFVPYGQSKSDFISDNFGMVQYDDVLIDDYTRNLKEWHGIGIKLLNGINSTKGTWNGFCIKHDMEPNIMYNQVMAIANWMEEK